MGQPGLLESVLGLDGPTADVLDPGAVVSLSLQRTGSSHPAVPTCTIKHTFCFRHVFSVLSTERNADSKVVQYISIHNTVYLSLMLVFIITYSSRQCHMIFRNHNMKHF